MEPTSKRYERPNIAAMRGYVSGEQLGGDVVKLNTNENPYPPAPEVAAALARIDVAALRRYPDPLADEFRRAAARIHGVDPDNVLATNGSDELLRLAFTTFVSPGACVAWPEPAYSLYPVLAAIQDCRVYSEPLDPDYRPAAGFADRANAEGAALVCLVNPNAPSGALLALDTVRTLAAQIEGVLLLDEAYVDFVDPDQHHDTIPLIREFDNVLLTRTLSKGYSLAGLRFGYALGPAALLAPMRDKTRDAYNLDGIAQALATASIAARDHARDTWARVRAGRAQLAEALAQLGFRVRSSQTNFLLAQVPAGADARSLYEGLRDRNILVRWFDKPGLADKLRISVGTPAEHTALLTAIETLLASS